MPARKLTPKQEEFCRQYVALKFNGTQAAIAAGYAKGSAEAASSRMLRNVKVSETIASIVEKGLSKLDIKAEDVVAELAKMGFARIDDYVEWDDKAEMQLRASKELEDGKSAALREIEFISSDIGNRVKFKLHDKKGPLELLGKNLNMFKDRVDITSGDKEIEGPLLYLPDNGRDKKE